MRVPAPRPARTATRVTRSDIIAAGPSKTFAATFRSLRFRQSQIRREQFCGIHHIAANRDSDPGAVEARKTQIGPMIGAVFPNAQKSSRKALRVDLPSRCEILRG